MPLRKSLEQFPAAVGEWQGKESTVFDADVVELLKATDYVMRRYVDGGGRSVWLYMAYWESQRRGAQIHSPKNCLPGSGREPLEAGVITVPVAGASSITINRYVVQKERESMLVLYWYQSQGRAVAGELEARLQMARNAMVRNRTDGALIRVSSPVHGSLAATEARLVNYVHAIYPRLADHLPE